MRRPIVIIIGFIVLIFVVLIVLFGLKGPEMPIQEVHKVIPMSKFQQQTTIPPLPAVPAPGSNIQSTVNSQQPLPAVPQPGTLPAGGNNVGQPVVNTPPQTVQPILPATGQPAPVVNGATGQTNGQTQSTVPLIIPQQNQPQQPLPSVPQPGNVPGNANGIPARN